MPRRKGAQHELGPNRRRVMRNNVTMEERENAALVIEIPHKFYDEPILIVISPEEDLMQMISVTQTGLKMARNIPLYYGDPQQLEDADPYVQHFLSTVDAEGKPLQMPAAKWKAAQAYYAQEQQAENDGVVLAMFRSTEFEGALPDISKYLLPAEVYEMSGLPIPAPRNMNHPLEAKYAYILEMIAADPGFAQRLQLETQRAVRVYQEQQGDEFRDGEVSGTDLPADDDAVGEEA